MLFLFTDDIDQKHALSKKDDVKENTECTKGPSSALTEAGTTTRQTLHDENVFARRFVLVDSTNDLKEIRKRKKEFHLFAFVCPFKRYTKERKRFLKKISKISHFYDKSVLIFTQCAKEQEFQVTKEINAVSMVDKKFKKLCNKAPILFCPTDSEFYPKFRREFVEKLVDIVLHRFTLRGIRLLHM